VEVGPGELDGVLEILVVSLEEGERRGALAQQIARRDGSGARLPRARERDLAQIPDAPPALRSDMVANVGEGVAAVEGVALRLAQQVSDLAPDRLDDPEAGEELEVQADAQQPARIGQLATLWTMSPTRARPYSAALSPPMSRTGYNG
jgi:hypothetical protein